MEQYVRGFQRFHAGEDVRPVTPYKFLLFCKEIKTFKLFRKKNEKAFSPQARKLEFHHIILNYSVISM